MRPELGDQLPVRIPVREEVDVAMVRKRVREVAHQEGFSLTATEALATASSEIAWNIVRHARGGDVLLGPVREAGRLGILVVARDEGPGIPDVERALQDGYSTKQGLGLGLSGAKRLVDELEIHTAIGEGTVVVMKKWCPAAL